jgi:transcription initiation factor TFIID subunit 2
VAGKAKQIMALDSESTPPELDFTISHQTVALDIDFPTKSLTGSTTITINPLTAELKNIPLNFTQGKLTRLTVNGKACATTYNQWWEYQAAGLGCRQWNVIQNKIDPWLQPNPAEELNIVLPKNIDRMAADPYESRKSRVSKQIFRVKEDNPASDSAGRRDSSAPEPRNAEDAVQKFTSILVQIDFTIEDIRNGLQFVGLDKNDQRYPHVYTTNSQFSSGAASCLFPCVDNLWSRHTFELVIKCPRTVADAFQSVRSMAAQNDLRLNNGIKRKFSQYRSDAEVARRLGRPQEIGETDGALEMIIVGAGDLASEVNYARLQRIVADSIECGLG